MVPIAYAQTPPTDTHADIPKEANSLCVDPDGVGVWYLIVWIRYLCILSYFNPKSKQFGKVMVKGIVATGKDIGRHRVITPLFTAITF